MNNAFRFRTSDLQMQRMMKRYVLTDSNIQGIISWCAEQSEPGTAFLKVAFDILADSYIDGDGNESSFQRRERLYNLVKVILTYASKKYSARVVYCLPTFLEELTNHKGTADLSSELVSVLKETGFRLYL